MARVLIVEDSLTSRMELAEAFEEVGLEPVPVANLYQARLALRQDGPFQLISLDLHLPDGLGIDLLRELRADGDTTPVMIISDDLSARQRVEALQSGAQDYHAKVANFSPLVQRAQSLLPEGEVRSPPPRNLVLLIDDSATVRAALREQLEEAGLDVLEAADGEEGLRLARRSRPVAIVVDQVMPGMDGIAFVRRARSESALRDIPCLVLTGSTDRANEIAGLDAGADAYLRKSEPFEVIVARVQASVRKGQQSAEAPASSRVLVVADEPQMARRIADLLRAEDCDVAVADGRGPALDELLALQPPDAMVVQCDQTAGPNKLSRFLAQRIPLVVAGRSGGDLDVREALARGADDFLPANVDDNVLVARIRAQVRRKQADDAVTRTRQALERAKESDRAKSIFFANMSHELRTPLNAIIGYAEMLLEDESDRTKRDDLLRIEAAGKHLLDLINDVLDLSKLAAGRLELNSAPVAVSEILAVVQSLVSPLASRNHNRLVLEVHPETPRILWLDPLRLRQLLVNLAANACKFTDRGEVRLIARPGPEDHAPQVIFEVQDTGIGIAAEHQQRIFDPFTQVDGTATRKQGGTGLGLSICRSLARLMGGDVTVDSQPGVGSTFRLTLPATAPPST